MVNNPPAGRAAQNAIATAHIALHCSTSSYARRAPTALLPLRVVAVVHLGQAVKRARLAGKGQNNEFATLSTSVICLLSASLLWYLQLSG